MVLDPNVPGGLQYVADLIGRDQSSDGTAASASIAAVTGSRLYVLGVMASYNSSAPGEVTITVSDSSGTLWSWDWNTSNRRGVYIPMVPPVKAALSSNLTATITAAATGIIATVQIFGTRQLRAT